MIVYLLKSCKILLSISLYIRFDLDIVSKFISLSNYAVFIHTSSKWRIGKNNIKSSVPNTIDIEKSVMMMYATMTISMHYHIHLGCTCHTWICICTVYTVKRKAAKSSLSIIDIRLKVHFRECIRNLSINSFLLFCFQFIVIVRDELSLNLFLTLFQF